MVRCALATCILLAGLPAQSPSVLPGSHSTSEGTGTTSIPFGRSTPVRVQMVYDGMLFPQAGSVSALAFRLDGGTQAAARQVDCEIRMSTMPAPLVAMRAVFAQNRGADEAVVLPRQILTLAGQSIGTVPNAFLAPIPLSAAFAYDPALGPLVIEIVVHAQPPGTYALDATWICTSPDLPVGPPACPASAGPLRVESATGQVMWGRLWTVRVLDALPGTLTALVLGFQATGQWNGFALPFDLAPLGAPGCFVSIEEVASFLQPARGDGTVSHSFPIPNVPALVGTPILFQAGAVDPSANPLGVVTSQARRVEVCGWEPVGRVWAADLAAAVGQWEIGVAPVVQVTIQ